MSRHVCIHGHFYQPPRENPWLEAVEEQDSAHPAHDWNERVTEECYAPNTASRLLGEDGRIVEIVNNYARISFNVGPTLLEWLEEARPQVYDAILEADAESRRRFGGHGSALAQVYNHQIMPLANRRDRRTQIRWGIADFRRRFGRRPEGMWLPETAVDIETLELLADEGIGFTLLAPRQARRVRGGRSGEWRTLDGEGIDTSRPYTCRLPGGGEIVVFFYDGALARAVAFGDLLESGDVFGERLLSASRETAEGGLVHLATDGETYGHHHRHGEMALTRALKRLGRVDGVELTNYGAYLEEHPPRDQVEIVEESSWSCVHGVERWRSDCGCHTGGEPDWDQAWRRPLREALNELRDELAPRFEEAAGELLQDPWAARDDYVDVILDRSTDNVDHFLRRHARKELTGAEEVRALELLELQRQAMLMFTSCGWFFNDLAGIETRQVLRYAGRAVQLAEDLFGDGHERRLLQRLEAAQSNRLDRGSGRQIYLQSVRPARVDLPRVCAHYAVGSLFDGGQEATTEVYAFRVESGDRRELEIGRARMATGRARTTSVVTRKEAVLEWAALHFGDHNVMAGVRPVGTGAGLESLRQELEETFRRMELSRVVRLLDRRFPGGTHSLRSLFRDDQRRILGRILRSRVERVEELYREVFREQAALMHFVSELEMPPPRAFEMTAEFVVNAALRDALEERRPDRERTRRLLEEAEDLGVELDRETLAYAARSRLEELAGGLDEEPRDRERLEALAEAVETALELPFRVDLWEVQNRYWEILRGSYLELRGEEDPETARWRRRFEELGEMLSVALPGGVPPAKTNPPGTGSTEP